MVFWLLLYCTSGKKRWIFGGLAAAGAACVAAYKLFAHVQVRVLAWKDPFAVVDNEGYQPTLSLYLPDSSSALYLSRKRPLVLILFIPSVLLAV